MPAGGIGTTGWGGLAADGAVTAGGQPAQHAGSAVASGAVMLGRAMVGRCRRMAYALGKQ